MERIALLGASLFYVASFCSMLVGLKMRQFRPGRLSFGAMISGVICQTWFLVLRGGIERACPMGTLSETLIFLGWSVGLFYLVIGPVYRISLLGFFTAPLILTLQGVAFLLPPVASVSSKPMNPWIEAHAALSLMAFGAWGLSCIAGVMFLVQEKQLKSQSPSLIFHHLPPISLLVDVIVRLLWVGMVLLTVSFAAGSIVKASISGMKFWVSLGLWGAYFMMLVMYAKRLLSSHRLALWGVVIYGCVLIILPLIHYLSTHI